MNDSMTELQALGGALGFELVDELAAYRQHFDQVMTTTDAAPLAMLKPLMEQLLDTAARDRSSAFGWSLHGRSDGVPVNVRPVSRGAAGGGAGYRITQIEALLEPPLHLGLAVTHESLMSRAVQKLTGRHDLQTGNAELDRLIHVRAGQPEATAALLTDSGVQLLLLQAYGVYPWPRVTDAEVRIELDGFVMEVDKVKAAIDRAAPLAAALSARSTRS